jgi:hypothetical protein
MSNGNVSQIITEGFHIAALWSTSDKRAMHLFNQAVAAEKIGDREKAIKLSYSFDEQILNHYNDNRTRLTIEPETSAIATNKVFTDGISRFNEIIADKSVEFFYYIASGTGTTSVSVGQHRLAAENARVDMRVNGVFDAAGNVQINRAMFPTGIADATVTEFGGCDTPTDPSTFAWRVLLDESEYFDHVQGDTWYTGSHYLVTYSK